MHVDTHVYTHVRTQAMLWLVPKLHEKTISTQLMPKIAKLQVIATVVLM